MTSFNILDPTTNVLQNRLLEASAGTGKTFAIEHLFVRLILEEKAEVSEILAVTFTKEAALEMTERIHANLKSSSHIKARQALANFDDAQIFTIHSFCHKMLKEFSFQANTFLSHFAEGDFLLEMKKTIEDFFRLAPLAFSQDIAQLLKKERFDLQKMIDKIIEAIQQEEEPIPLHLPKLAPLSFEELWQDLSLLSPRYKRLNPTEEQVKKFALFLSCQDPSVLLEEKEWFFEKMREENTKISATAKENIPLHFPHFFTELEQNFLPYLAVLKDSKEALKRVAKGCKALWVSKQNRFEYFTFDDLLYKMKKALEIPSFAQKVQARYKVVIIDEFQDTNAIQWKLFEKLFLENHLLYLVGDPKQAIYGFRKADIYTYLQAAKVLGEDSKVLLDTNYRSSPQLVQALNTLFTKNQNWLKLPALSSALPYHPVKAGRTENRLQEPPITYFGLKELPTKERTFPTKEMEEKLIFPYLAQEIWSLQKKYELPFSQMTVLIKDRFQAQRLQQYFQKVNLPSHIKTTVSLAESRGFIAMEMLLQATLHSYDRKMTTTAAYALFLQEPPALFSHLQNVFQEKGFAYFFKEFIAKHSSLPPALYLEMRHTAELLMQQKGASLKALLLWMQELKDIDPQGDERLKMQTTAYDAIPLMTTFASKGLEFAVVFALSTSSTHAKEEPSLEKEAEKLRQLYVAFTRAKEKLYIPIVFREKKTQILSASELFFENWEGEVVLLEERSFAKVVVEKEEKKLLAPSTPTFDFPPLTLISFSQLIPSPIFHGGLDFGAQDLTVKTPHSLPLGTETGIFIHAAFEAYFQNPTTPLAILVSALLYHTPLQGWEKVLLDMMQATLCLPLLKDFCLNDLKEGEYFQEAEFLFSQKSDLVKGFIDLVFKKGDTVYIVDWKTNWLGKTIEDYTEDKMQEAMKAHSYDLQAKLYSQAVKRYIQQFAEPLSFGGAFYIFVRGNKVVHLGSI